MTENRFVRYLIYLSLWPTAILFYPHIQGIAAYIFWWMASQSGATTLTRSAFAGEMWLPIVAFDGVVFGLVPIDQLRGWAAHSLGYLSYRSSEIPASRQNLFRPELWAWVAPTVAFLLRFVTFDTHRDSSVLGASTLGRSRLAHFFGPPPAFSFSLSSLEFFSDRLYLTSPMLFLLSYVVAAQLRRRLTEVRDAQTEDSSASLIHSAPELNMPEPTEIPE